MLDKTLKLYYTNKYGEPLSWGVRAAGSSTVTQIKINCRGFLSDDRVGVYLMLQSPAKKFAGLLCFDSEKFLGCCNKPETPGGICFLIRWDVAKR